MGFYNMQQGDAPYLKSLADQYSMSDNYHQAVSGGTGANHIMLGTGDGHLVQRRQRQSGDAAAQPGHRRRHPEPGHRRRGRKPQPIARHQQLVHRGRLWRRLLRLALLRRRQLQRVRRHFAARSPLGRRLPAIIAAPGRSELPARSLLSAQQLQSGLFRRRHQRLCPDRQPEQHRVHGPAVAGQEHRQRAAESQRIVCLFRRPVRPLPARPVLDKTQRIYTATSAISCSTQPRS